MRARVAHSSVIQAKCWAQNLINRHMNRIDTRMRPMDRPANMWSSNIGVIGSLTHTLTQCLFRESFIAYCPPPSCAYFISQDVKLHVIGFRKIENGLRQIY